MPHADIIILGAGIAGLSTAYHLAVNHRVKNIKIIDERTPLGLTSSRGTMAYRNWYPGPGDAMVQLMNRSIDLLQEIDRASTHAIALTQNGYMYFTAQESQIPQWREIALDAAQRGVGEFREHSNASNYQPTYRDAAQVPSSDRSTSPIGTDLLTNPDTILALYPNLTRDVRALLHIRRCGSFDAISLGRWLLQQAQLHGVEYLNDRVTNIVTRGNRIHSVQLASGGEFSCGTLILAAGPLLPSVARMLEIELPVYNELHAKVTFEDTAQVFPRYGDLLLWNDAQTLPWSQFERDTFLAAPETRHLVEPFPGGVHFLPKGTSAEPKVMALWTYDIHPVEYLEPPAIEPHYAEIILRGLGRMIPAAETYYPIASSFTVDGGYYCKTAENRPLIGPLPIDGAYIIGALSGFGVMASQGAAELCASHIVGAKLPAYADSFLLSRYSDSAYQQLLQNWDSRSGQL